MEECVTSKLRLPDLNGIRIESISDEDADLSSFLSDCTPSRLNLLNVNHYHNSLTGIKSEFYVDSFSEAAARTTKEVYFVCIDFSADDLQTVVRAARNAERIVFYFCCIHCSPDLDFGKDLSYNTKLLSFQGWGSTSFIERTTDWKADPLCFSYIVDAIGNSGLRDSLEELNIFGNPTLTTSKMQAELDMKLMSHIFVIEENLAPLES